jgi:hypothetical protein
VPELSRMSGTRIVASPASLDNAVFPKRALVFRFASDEVFVTAKVDAKRIADPYAIVVPEQGFSGIWLAKNQADEFLRASCEWELPTMRPAFAQGMVAGLAMKLYFEEKRVLLMVPAPFAQTLLERLA